MVPETLRSPKAGLSTVTKGVVFEVSTEVSEFDLELMTYRE